jgi:Secretion system C-terminal sorting domain
MKKLIFLFTFFFIVVCGNAQVEYTPFQFETSVWEESSYAVWFSTSEYEISVEGDTLIDNKIYFKLMKRGMEYYYDSPQQNMITDSLEIDDYIGAIREYDFKLVDYISKYQTSPVTIYDFNLEEGDTTQIFDLNFGIIDAKVTTVDTVEICGTFRNRYEIRFIGSWLPIPVYLIEGLGSTNGIIPNYELFESAAYLHCYSNSTCDCFDSTVSTQQVNKDEIDIHVYPNPVSQNEIKVFFSNTQNSSIEIYNPLGQRVYENTIDFDHHTIDCMNWPNGCYFLKITNDKWQQTKTILLQRE